MDDGVDVYCYICFAIPGELCRTKYVVHGNNEVTPVICLTHSSRLVDEQGTYPAFAPEQLPDIEGYSTIRSD
jgi:hypothetical protein